MRRRYVHYDLEQGFIHNWLVASPQAISIDLGQFPGDNFRQQITEHYYESTSGISKTPVERGPLTKGLFQVGDYTGSWNYYACREDHLIEHSGFYPTPYYLRSWAYTQLDNKIDQEVLLVLTTHGPADVWINDQHVQRQENFYELNPTRTTFTAHLKNGANKILIRFEAVAIHQCPYAIALQICRAVKDQSIKFPNPYPARAGIHVCIPTLIQPISRRNIIERAYQSAYIVQDTFQWEDEIRLYWSEDLDESSPAVIRLMTPTGKIYAEATVDGTEGDQVFLSFPHQIPPGPYHILMMPLAWEYYDRNIRITHEFNIWNLGKNQYSTKPYGTYLERRQEALINATQYRGLYAEVAKMALNRWTEVDSELIIQILNNVHVMDFLGILGMLFRFGDHERFPKDLLLPMEETILGFQYKMIENCEAVTGGGEADRLLFHAVEILAGQRYPERKFLHSGKTGRWHLENGERLALEWLHQRGEIGFSDWDSNSTFSACLLTLSHLIGLAETESIWEMSAVVMDKLFITMAVNSYQGVFGSTHGRTYAQFVKGGLLEPTSGISRLMWGTGIFNHHIAAPVSLACMERYELPSIIADIAVQKPEELWSQEHHAVNSDRFVNKVTYKTPDGMLCSAQDYYPGEKGHLEHIWQATLGTSATVFVTHPACSSEDDSRQPNFWVGNAILPRVAQWKDSLIAVYHLPEDDWMGFTHAYFPTYTFDEYVLREGWAFARKGNGYLALMTQRGFDLIRHGQYAFRELRSYGQKNIWLCYLGRTRLDGDFGEFQEKVIAMPVEFDEDSVCCATLRNEMLSFGWQRPFFLNGQEQPISGFNHYDHPYIVSGYPCKQMEIRNGEDVLRLTFE